MNNDKDLRRLICEIILLVCIVIIIIPICVNASNDYKYKVWDIKKSNSNVLIDISSSKGGKIITLVNDNDDKTVVNLVMKISKYSNNYMMVVNGREYKLSEMSYSEDDDNYYYSLGNYVVKDKVKVTFDLEILGDAIYDDSVTYSFLAEAVN